MTAASFVRPIFVAAVLLVVLPFALLAGGLTMTSATDVVIFAVACMALNILVGQTGLVSFGHGAWFGLGAYAAALAQLHWFRGSMLWPTLFALCIPDDSFGGDWISGVAPARRVFLVADIGLVGTRVLGCISVDGVYWRRKRTRRLGARQLARR